ncbi:MAG: ADP-heptose:LPS heptosyltransferase [Saprospiraceae bacterium]|jgi:ADP-heptose:LPS heptosyltransferase
MITISTKLDINTITIDEAKALFVELLKTRKLDKSFLQEVVDKYSSAIEDSDEEMIIIEQLVNKHFKEYDEVFKALA